MTKNYLDTIDFWKSIEEETFEERLWKNLCELQKFQTNLLKAKILKKSEVEKCPVCGDCQRECDNCDWCATSPETGK